MPTTGLSMGRRVLASLASLAAGAILVSLVPRWTSLLPSRFGLDWVFASALPASALGAAIAIWIRRPAAQIAARGFAWSLLSVGAVMASELASAEAARWAVVAVLAAVALLAAGCPSLDEGGVRTWFQPRAFRGTLVLMLSLAIGETMSLVWATLPRLSASAAYGMPTVHVEGGAPARLLLGALLVALPLLGVVGLLRLRAWGLMLGVASNLAVLALVLTNTLPIQYPDWYATALRHLFIATATLQLVIPLPMIVALALGRIPDPDRWRGAKVGAVAAAIIAVAAFACYAALSKSSVVPVRSSGVRAHQSTSSTPTASVALRSSIAASTPSSPSGR